MSRAALPSAILILVVTLGFCTALEAQSTGYSDALLRVQGATEPEGRYSLVLELRPGKAGFGSFDGFLVFAEPSHTLLTRHWQFSGTPLDLGTPPLASTSVDEPVEGQFRTRFPFVPQGDDGISISLVVDGEAHHFARGYVSLDRFDLSFEFDPDALVRTFRGEPDGLRSVRTCCSCEGPGGSCSECTHCPLPASPVCTCPGCDLSC